MGYSNAHVLRQVTREIRANEKRMEFVRKWLRRSVSIPAYFLAWGLTVILSPVLLAFFAAADIIKPGSVSFPRTRCVLFAMLYLSCEVACIAASFGIWLLSGRFLYLGKGLFVRMNVGLETMWAVWLFEGARRIFSFTVETDGEEHIPPGPILFFIRHVSMADTVLASIYVTRTTGIFLRHILKKELLWDPCLDIVGNRLPHMFIDRSGSQTWLELNNIRRMSSELGVSDGVLIYPEGTRFSRRKREKALARLEKNSPRLFEKALRMKNVLPPRIGGPLSLLETAREADVVFCAHTGFEGASAFRNFWAGSLVGKTIRVKFSRVRAADIPREQEPFADWLFAEWKKIDDWVSAQTEREYYFHKYGR